MSLVALHRVHFDIGSGVQIEIESVLGRGQTHAVLFAAPGLVSADEEVDAKQFSSGGLPPMCWRAGGELFEPFQLREDTDYFVDVTVPLPIVETCQRAATHSAWPFNLRLASAFTREPVKRWREIEVGGRQHTIVTGQLRLRSHAGVLDLGTELGGSLRAEVVCRKLQYFDEFKSLLDGLAEKATELLLAYDTPVSLSFGLSQEQAGNDAALHFLLRYVMSPLQLPAAFAEVLNTPHARLVERLEVKPIEEVEEGHTDLISDHLDVSSLGQGGPLARFFGGYTPRELPQRETFESHDTPENRYAKALLEHCRLLAQRLEVRMGARKRKAAEREAKSWSLQLDELLQHGLWREVGPLGQLPANSQIMLRGRGYKELFRLDLSLRMSLGLAWSHGTDLADGLVGDSRPVNQIYEYWCFFVLRDVLRSLCLETGGGNFLSVSADGLRVQLAKGRRSECRFEYTCGNGTSLGVSLFYNRRFLRPRVPQNDWSGSYTAAFDPDYSILIRSPNGPAHWLHFDAKYRLERQQAEAMFEADEDSDDDAGVMADYEAELVRVHKQEDLFKMHTYRDGILSTRGAYVLFPGDGVGGQTVNPNPNLFVRHPSALGSPADQLVPSVGAFPLTPEGSGGQVEAISELLKATLEEVGAGAPYEEERGWFGPTP
ncbi:restriction endonuclease-like protein [Chromobacterium violaceum]|uniref:DUF2357 domain-containing protein n=1 Tax=Chromobacterium violaceum (strain ATCC 12472 / DSM 30191 / JCM 1249 / CCUG 213 / NBRC 12614 / NCIMB 9131 / NCTC 9757 / MK) TaxID=243365 RepID=Q7P254_CHRVO|nr:restriction endonuclease-like protein [Chromobacterium violaceum]AAQ57687.1 conserved hypothetical protein [Chromobacterium violaceum ATCC 12472]SUX40712.1 Domain of uncharacterised function (DUF2357) [Chromobacterium violaceum]